MKYCANGLIVGGDNKKETRHLANVCDNNKKETRHLATVFIVSFYSQLKGDLVTKN